MSNDNSRKDQAVQLPDHWHRGYSSRKQQRKFEGRKPRKLIGKKKRRAA
jgi:hypothetical protein